MRLGLTGHFVKVVCKQYGLIAINQYCSLANCPIFVLGAVGGLQVQHHPFAKIVHFPADQCAGIERVHLIIPQFARPRPFLTDDGGESNSALAVTIAKFVVRFVLAWH